MKRSRPKAVLPEGEAADAGSSSDDEDVVDAEFSEVDEDQKS